MSFDSLSFVVFFIFAVSVFYLLKQQKHRILFLLASSYFFYGCWNYRFLTLIFLSTTVDYFVARRLQVTEKDLHRKLILSVSVALNLCVLAFFKYYNFGVESMVWILQHMGLHPNMYTLKIILPVGISFYTFQTMSYSIDVYRRKIAPEPNFPVYALYVSFFPQLVAGPIESGGHLIPQLKEKHGLTIEAISTGVQRILTGLFLKVVLADSMILYVEHAFANPESVSGVTSCLAILGFTCQIFGDFAGYSLIARGCAGIFGIQIIENFRMPYFSRTPVEFWTRWHISLSRWLRDYLYISLGGNRRGKSRTYFNLFATMFLGGLWHGASWHFVLWGAYHGVLLAIYNMLGVRRWVLSEPITKLAHACLTFVLVAFGWLFFRADSTGLIVAILRNIIFNFHLGPESFLYIRAVSVVFATVMIHHSLRTLSNRDYLFVGTPRPVHVALCVFMILLVLCNWSIPASFIYFQF